MSRNDKVGVLVLGALLFSGLFYFIYTTMRNPLPPDAGTEDFTAGDTFKNDENLTDEEATTPEEDAPLVSTGTTTTSPAVK